MAIVTGTNSSLPNVIDWATSGSDRFFRQAHLAGLTENFDAHDHSAGKGLPVARLASGVPATNGQVNVNGDDLQWFGTALQTAVRLAGTQVITGLKTFQNPVVMQSSLTVGNSLVVSLGGLLVTGNAGFNNNVTVVGRATWSTNGTGAVGSVYKDAAGGLVVQGVSGSAQDFTLLNNAGAGVLAVPAGTQNVAVGGALSVAGATTFTGNVSAVGTVALSAGKTVTQKTASIPLNPSSGAYATIYTVPANSYGALHVSSTCPNGPSRTYQQVLWVSDGTGLVVAPIVPGAAISGASGSNLSFTATGLNIQARGSTAFTPDGCKVWAEYASIGTGG